MPEERSAAVLCCRSRAAPVLLVWEGVTLAPRSPWPPRLLQPGGSGPQAAMSTQQPQCTCGDSLGHPGRERFGGVTAVCPLGTARRSICGGGELGLPAPWTLRTGGNHPSRAFSPGFLAPLSPVKT